jgi:hypothetical protein
MTVTKDEIVIHAAPEEPTADATPAVDEQPAVDEVPEELQQKARDWAEGYRGRLTGSVERYLDGLRSGAGAQALGEPQVGQYVAFDLWATTPIQFTGLPPYQPGKIIAGGEWALIYAVLFVNPVADVSSGFAVPPTVQLSNRTYRVGLERINLTDVTDGPDDVRQGVFSAPAPTFTEFYFWFQAPNPGVKPRFVEANLSADIVGAAQPYAAFASNILDLDASPPLWQNNIPLRYLVYSK